MAFLVSPGINISEVDLTAAAGAVSVSDAAFAGPFQWGPALSVQSIGSEDVLVSTFGKPDDTIFTYWFSAAAFLAYSNLLRVVRVVSNNALNSTADAKALTGTVDIDTGTTTVTSNTGFSTTGLVVGQSIVIGSNAAIVNSITNTTSFTIGTAWVGSNAAGATISAYGLLIENSDVYTAVDSTGVSGIGPWAGKYPGDLGNSLKISVCSGNSAFASVPANGTIATTLGSNTVTGTSTAFLTELAIGDLLIANGKSYPITAIANDISLTLGTAAASTLTAPQGSWSRKWQYSNLFDRAPGTSSFISQRGGSFDELHVVVVDEDGTISGIPGTVLERFPFVSKAKGATDLNGTGNYYADVVNAQSKYIWWLGAPATNSTNWGSNTYTSTFGVDVLPESDSLQGGQSRNQDVTDANLEAGYDLFANKDVVDVSLVITGPASTTLGSYVIQNVCESRGDCVAFVSPQQSDVVNNSGSEVADITTTRNALPSSSFGFMDSGWKYTYDKYNAKYRWVPLNGDIAGLAARTDSTNDPWFSPAGFTRGNIKNVVKLAWNPSQLNRDDLYKLGINPVVSFPAQGVILYGDKTLLDRPSAFDRINVRRLFIILEKTISNLAQAQLFEFNDDFTRSQFRNIIEPYLRDVKARRGVTDYQVVCDNTNNTDAVIEANQFVGDIYVKPSRSINFIQLNFVAVPSEVSFQTVVSQ